MDTWENLVQICYIPPNRVGLVAKECRQPGLKPNIVG